METNREMVNSGIPWIGDVPKSWKIVRNKDVFNNSKTLVGENWINTQLLSLTTKGIKPVAIGSTSGKVPDSYETYQVVEKDNLVMCLFDLDCSAVFSGLSPICGMISPAYKALTIKKGYSPDFYAKWFDYIFDGRKFMFLSKNIRYSLTYDEFASLQVVAPSLSEQQRIAEFLDRKCAEVDEMIALQEQIIEELKAYKQSVITEAVTKGLNPAAPMRDSGIDWIDTIPCHWIVRKMKSLIDLKSGSNLTSEQISEKEDGYPVYGGNGLRGTYSEYSNEGDYVLVGRQGALCGNINYTSGKFWVTEHALVCYPKEVLDIRWLGESLRTMNLNQYSLSAAQPGLSAERIKNLYMIVPPTNEQQAIADYLDEKCADIDALIATKQQKIDSLKEYKKSIIYEYVTGKKEIA